jgi:hypothetical protein
MASTSKTYQLGDIGSPIGVVVYRADGTLESQLGSATTIQIILEKPSEASVTKTATLVTDGSDGQMHYITAEGDLDEVGTWNYHGYVVIGAGKWKTTVKTFEVLENL